MRNVVSFALVSALLGSSALLAGCSDDGGPSASTDAGSGGGDGDGDGGSGVGGDGGSGVGGDGGGGVGGDGGSGVGGDGGSGVGGDGGGGGDDTPPGACVGGSTEEANTDPDDPVQQAADQLV
ncbi:MAG TPA: serine hydrolase, partial [Sorangium sp.]|nr:serine hydrolase [Sorangium sp.]